MITDALMKIVRGDINRNANKIAIFDLDKTLIVFEDNKTSEFAYLFPNVRSKLRELSKNGYFIGIASNQNLLKDKMAFESKIQKILEDLDIPLVFLASLKDSCYRKPCDGMYLEMLSYLDNKSFIEKIYVGDAAGREKDISDADIKFAYNCNLNFYTPEQFFLGRKDKVKLKKVDIQSYRTDFKITHADVIFVYGMGSLSGKKTFVQKYFKDYVVNPPKIKKKSVYINSNNLSLIENLNTYKKFNFVCYFLDYSDNIRQYLKNLAKLSGESSLRRKVFKKKTIELFKDVIKVPFIFDDANFDAEKLRISKMQL